MSDLGLNCFKVSVIYGRYAGTRYLLTVVSFVTFPRHTRPYFRIIYVLAASVAFFKLQSKKKKKILVGT